MALYTLVGGAVGAMNIFVDGTRYRWINVEIGYEDICRLIRGTVDGPALSIAYEWQGTGDLTRSGTLVQGDDAIKPAERMTFTTTVVV